MAVMLRIEATYKKPSAFADKKDLKEVVLFKPWPIMIEEEDFVEMQVANFYVKNFFLDDWFKQDPVIAKEYRGKHNCMVDSVRALSDEEIEQFIESGDLLAVEPSDLTAKEIGKMKRSDLIKCFMMMDGDQTKYLARTKTTWQGRDIVAQRDLLKEQLGLSDAVEQVKAKDKKRTSKLLKAKSKDTDGEVKAPVKRRRAPRKPKETLEVSE